MKSDGTEVGTIPIKSVHSSSLVNYGDAFVHNGKMYFTFFEVDYNRFIIWESDRTEANTKLIFDQYYSHSSARLQFWLKAIIFNFTVGNASSGTTLAKFDLQNKTLEPIKDIAGVVDEPFIFSQSTPLILS